MLIDVSVNHLLIVSKQPTHTWLTKKCAIFVYIILYHGTFSETRHFLLTAPFTSLISRLPDLNIILLLLCIGGRGEGEHGMMASKITCITANDTFNCDENVVPVVILTVIVYYQ